MKKLARKFKSIPSTGIILIPFPDAFEGNYPFTHYKGQLILKREDSPSEIHVLLCNCSKIMSIPDVITKQIKQLESCIKKNPEMEDLYEEILFYRTLREVILIENLNCDVSEDLMCKVWEKWSNADENNVLLLNGENIVTNG